MVEKRKTVKGTAQKIGPTEAPAIWQGPSRQSKGPAKGPKNLST